MTGANPRSVELVTPELALIDPELARADLARPRPAPAAPKRVDIPPPREPRRARRYAAPILLSVSLAANGFLLATLAADDGGHHPVPAASAAVPSQLPAARAAVEQKVLAAVVQSPAGKLPNALIDRQTGLAKNNLQAVCRRVSDSFLCTVRPARHRPGEGLQARYRDGSFTWYPYQAG